METPNTLDDKIALENEMSWDERDIPKTIYGLLSLRKKEHGDRSAISFQLLSDPESKAETLSWAELHGRVTQAANLFHSMGIGKNDVVAFLLPNSTETVVTLLGAAIAGVVNPINPLLDAEQIGGILKTSNAKILVTLKPFPKTEIPQLAARSVAAMAPNVEHILEVDLCRYLSPPKSWMAAMLRPKNPAKHNAKVSDFHASVRSQPADQLIFEDGGEDRIVGLFHTGGTTGIPKLAQHTNAGIVFNGWAAETVGLKVDETVLCPLPLFHVFAAYPALMSTVASGGHIIFPTPAGYRGDGVFDNFWKLVERWQATFVLIVPTAISALMQRPIDADISSLKAAVCGSATLPMGLYKKFEDAVGIKILEGYGLTEATCLVSINPLNGERKIGSVGLPVPYAQVRVLECDKDGNLVRECQTGEGGEICISGPGVLAGSTYLDPSRNEGLFVENDWLRTGDLGYLDDDGYLTITGRAKDLIIRGGQNVDPAWIEDPLASHEAVAFVGAVGQPDPAMGELPCAYVELVGGVSLESTELAAFADQKIENRLAKPEHIEIVDELPKTAVGKVFKPDLRKRAIKRVLNHRMQSENLPSTVTDVHEIANVGLSAIIANTPQSEKERVEQILDEYGVNWQWSDQ